VSQPSEFAPEPFFEAVWNLWNWQDIAARYASAIQLNIDIGEAA